LSNSQPFSDHKIRQTIEQIKAQGQNVSAWAVQSRLGGGDFTRIQQIIEQFYPNINQQVTASPAMQFNAQQHNGATAEDSDIIDKQMPADIEASMYQMQTTLGQMANQLWNDAASNAETQMRGKLFSAQQAHKEAQQAHVEAEVAKQKMQQSIAKLTAELDVLEVEHKSSLNSLEQERQVRQETELQRDDLLKNVETLQQENQTLEQTAFNANIQAAKAEGLAEIVKEQLALAKQSEKQMQKTLDRSEKKVNGLHHELHSASQSLRDQMRDRQVPLYPKNPSADAAAQLQAQYPAQELPPTPAAANEFSAPVAAPSQPKVVNQGNNIQDLGHSLIMTRAKKVAQDKTRSLSDKLFDRKKRQTKNNNK